MSYKIGDKVLLMATIICNDNTGNRPYMIETKQGTIVWVSAGDFEADAKTYTQGLEDAWELAKKILEMCGKKREEILNLGSYANILEFMTPEEALAKIEAYEKEKSEIKVGDVVERNGFKGVVVHILPDGELNIVYENGLFGASCSAHEYEKTGKHLEVADLLRQIGE